MKSKNTWSGWVAMDESISLNTTGCAILTPQRPLAQRGNLWVLAAVGCGACRVAAVFLMTITATGASARNRVPGVDTDAWGQGATAHRASPMVRPAAGSHPAVRAPRSIKRSHVTGAD